jgi:hypothetical protein
MAFSEMTFNVYCGFVGMIIVLNTIIFVVNVISMVITVIHYTPVYVFVALGLLGAYISIPIKDRMYTIGLFS